jgi:hypothetical protein
MGWWTGLFDILTELDKDAIGALGVKEKDKFAICALFGCRADGLKTFGFEPFDFFNNIVNGKGDVMYAFAPFLDRFGYSALWAGGLEQFDLGAAYLKERSLDGLTLDSFGLIMWLSQQLGIGLIRYSNIFYGYTDMFDLLHVLRI